jgi:hypothetical protein
VAERVEGRSCCPGEHRRSTVKTPFLKVLLAAAGTALAVILSLAGTASANNGWVAGRFQVWNTNGNFCAANATSCMGSRYTSVMFNSAQPIANAYVQIKDPQNNVIGTGGTDSNGDFNIGWYRATDPTAFTVWVLAAHKNWYFRVDDVNGNRRFTLTSAITPVPSSSGSPQNIGTWTQGAVNWSDPGFNAYWAGERVYRDVFANVAILVNNFTNVEVRGFADAIPGFLNTCNTSCANGATKRVQLDANAGGAWSPQARMMHEMGHVASYVTRPWNSPNDYSWPNQANNSGNWFLGPAPMSPVPSSEWGHVAFEEAFATHYANLALWWDNSVAPTACISPSSHCYDGMGNPLAFSNIEATSFPFATNNCVANEGRFVISHVRYLWDIYDTVNDCDGDTYSATAGDYWKHLHNPAWYPTGTGPNQHQEPWDSAMMSVTEPDGRGSSSYLNNYRTNVAETVNLNISNCWPN